MSNGITASLNSIVPYRFYIMRGAYGCESSLNNFRIEGITFPCNTSVVDKDVYMLILISNGGNELLDAFAAGDIELLDFDECLRMLRNELLTRLGS